MEISALPVVLNPGLELLVLLAEDLPHSGGTQGGHAQAHEGLERTSHGEAYCSNRTQHYPAEPHLRKVSL